MTFADFVNESNPPVEQVVFGPRAHPIAARFKGRKG
jgi:hypothetical protein